MLISKAYAEMAAPSTETTATTATPGTDPMTPPSTSAILMQNVGMIVLLVVMFYFLLIRPQQKRFKEHKQMIDALKTGDKVIVSGLVGKIASLKGDEVVIDLGETKVTALRSMVQTMPEKTAETAKK